MNQLHHALLAKIAETEYALERQFHPSSFGVVSLRNQVVIMQALARLLEQKREWVSDDASALGEE